METQEAKDTQRAGTGFMANQSEAQRSFEAKGYTENIVPCQDHFEVQMGRIKLYPKDFVVDERVRFENTSDPNDQCILYAISATNHHLKGIYIESYGLYQDDLSPAMLECLKANYPEAREVHSLPKPPYQSATSH